MGVVFSLHTFGAFSFFLHHLSAKSKDIQYKHPIFMCKYINKYFYRTSNCGKIIIDFFKCSNLRVIYPPLIPTDSQPYMEPLEGAEAGADLGALR